MHAQVPRDVHQLFRQPVDRRGPFDLALPGQLIDLHRLQAQGPADVANRAAEPIPIDVADHRDVLETPALIAEADHLVAPPPAKIDVDIRAIGSPGIHEALEVEPVLDGTDPREAQHMSDQRACGRAPDLDRDALALGEIDNLVDHEEIVTEAVLTHGRQLVFQPLDDLVTGGVVPLGQAQVTKPGQLPVAGGPVVELGLGQDRFALEQLEAAALDELVRVRQRPGTGSEDLFHARTGANVSKPLLSSGPEPVTLKRRIRARSLAVLMSSWDNQLAPVQAIGSAPRALADSASCTSRQPANR